MAHTITKITFIVGLPLALIGSHLYLSELADGAIKIPEATKSRWLEEITPTTSSDSREEELKALEKQLSDKAQSYRTQIDSERAQFRKELRSILDSGKAAAYSGIDPTIRYFTQFGNASSLVKDLAIDNAKAEATISSVVETNISNPINSMQKQIEEQLKNYTLRTQAIANRYTAEVQGTIRKYQNTGIDHKVLRKIETAHANAIKGLRETTKKNAIAATSTAINVAIEAACFKATKESAKTILKWAFKTATKRAGTTAAASGFAVVADGPVPIGDIIGVGIAIFGGIWTAYDISDAYTEIRNELPKSLKDGIDETIREAEQSAIDRLNSWNAQLPDKITF